MKTHESVMMDFDSSPQSIPSYLIGHEGAGSILEKLKSEGLATELGIDSGDHTKVGFPIDARPLIGYQWYRNHVSINMKTY